jgi:carbon-monoxide dehydrogenase large subunit
VLGAKGVGEAGVTGGVAAIMNAIVHALRSAGIDEFQMPATSDRIWRALHGGKPSMAKYAGAQTQ